MVREKGNGRWKKDSLRKLDARTQGHADDFILCPMLLHCIGQTITETRLILMAYNEREKRAQFLHTVEILTRCLILTSDFTSAQIIGSINYFLSQKFTILH